MTAEYPHVLIPTNVCGDCALDLPFSEFYADRSRTLGISPRCKACDNARRLRRLHKTPGSRRRHYDNVKRSVEKNWGSVGKYKRLRSLGLTVEKYEQMVEDQGRCCAICGTDQFWSDAVEHNEPCIDHCHATNTVRGLLCTWCNTMLGYAKDRPEVLRAASGYLEHHSTA